MDALCSTEIYIPEYSITKQKYAEYKGSSVTKEVPGYFNRFKCGRDLLDRLDI